MLFNNLSIFTSQNFITSNSPHAILVPSSIHVFVVNRRRIHKKHSVVDDDVTFHRAKAQHNTENKKTPNKTSREIYPT